MTDAERHAALEAIAAEVRVCTAAGSTRRGRSAVPGEGNPDTEVVFVGEGPGFNEDREGRPFVGRAGGLLVKLLALDRLAARGRLHHQRRQVPAARQPRSGARRDRRVRAVPASASSRSSTRRVVVTLGRYSMGRFMPGARISQAHGTARPVDPATGAANALGLCDVPPGRRAPDARPSNATSYDDIASVPIALLDARARGSVGRDRRGSDGRTATAPSRPPTTVAAPSRQPDVDAKPFADSTTSRLHAFNEPIAIAPTSLSPTVSDEPTPQLTLF